MLALEAQQFGNLNKARMSFNLLIVMSFPQQLMYDLDTFLVTIIEPERWYELLKVNNTIAILIEQFVHYAHILLLL